VQARYKQKVLLRRALRERAGVSSKLTLLDEIKPSFLQRFDRLWMIIPRAQAQAGIDPEGFLKRARSVQRLPLFKLSLPQGEERSCHLSGLDDLLPQLFKNLDGQLEIADRLFQPHLTIIGIASLLSPLRQPQRALIATRVAELSFNLLGPSNFEVRAVPQLLKEGAPEWGAGGR